MRAVMTIFLGVVLTAAGLVAGRILAGPTAAPTGEGGARGIDPGHNVSDVPHDAEGGAPKVLSPQTLKTLGVEIGEATRSDFVLTRKVQAVVIDRPRNVRPVVTPLGGIVVEVRVEAGDRLKADDPMIVIARDPIPRPKPELTGEILTPLSESVHHAVSSLRMAKSQLEVTEQELERIRPFVEKKTIPSKTAIDLKYELAKNRQAVANSREELALHGLTKEEIEAVEKGAHPPGNRSLWKRALQHNGLWTETAEKLYGTLTCQDCDLPWAVAAIGELAATGLMTDALVEAVHEQPELSDRFAEAVGLLLQGLPLDSVRLLAARGALDPQMEIRVPPKGASDWDVSSVRVRVGQRVEAGAEVVVLHDARTMWLRLEPIGAEIGLVMRTLEAGHVLKAVPLIEGSGPVLPDLRVKRMATQDEVEGRGAAGIAVVPNVPLKGPDTGGSRSWALRIGLRYVVHVPVQVLERRFVLPASALTMKGPEPVLFIQNGDEFRVQPVHLEYQDDRVVVIADDGSVYDGDPVVLKGAFALGLALDTGPAKADPHAGHSHQ